MDSESFIDQYLNSFLFIVVYKCQFWKQMGISSYRSKEENKANWDTICSNDITLLASSQTVPTAAIQLTLYCIPRGGRISTSKHQYEDAPGQKGRISNSYIMTSVSINYSTTDSSHVLKNSFWKIYLLNQSVVLSISSFSNPNINENIKT